ncbi:MAG: PAS domain-containing protein, partial [Asticcacaulis sp.]
MHPDDLEPTRRAFEAALDPDVRAPYDVEYRCIGKEDGVLRWVSAKGRGIFDDEGVCVRAMGTTLDISLRKQADQRRDTLVKLHDALRQTADIATTSYEIGRVLGEALSVSRVGFGTVDPTDDSFTVERDWTAKGVESLAGRLNLRDFGTFVDDLKAGHFIAIADTRQDPRTASATQALEARHARSFVNVPVVEKDKTVAVLYINNDKPRAWTDEDISLIKDISERARISVERARAERALQDLAASLEEQVQARTAERNLLATVFESTDSLIILVDLDYRILALNKAAIDDYVRGFGVEVKVGDHILDVIDAPEERAAARALWTRALNCEEFTTTSEFGLPHLARNTYDIKFNTLLDKDGHKIGAYQIVTNINERVAAMA